MVLVEKIGGALRLAAVDPAAARAGLTPGLTLADARARTPSLRTVVHRPEADAALLTQVMEDFGRFTPMIAEDTPHGLMLDVTGCTHLFGGEVGLVRAAHRRAGRIGLTVKSALASTPQAARALARFGAGGLFAAGEDRQAVRGLPVAALELPERDAQALQRAGLKRIADLDDRPRAPLAARFGTDFPARLARVLGDEDVRITPYRPAPPIVVDRVFFEPILTDADVERVLSDLLVDVADRLDQAGQGGRAFEAGFYRVDGQVRRIVVRTGRAARDVEAMLRLFRERLAALSNPLDPGFGFDQMRLSVLEAQRLAPAQRGLDGERPDGEDLSRLIDRLTARLAFIAKAGYAPYFLTIYDIVRVARDKRILCQGRGSAANSAVCYVLGITAVDPAESDLLFERFLSSDRGEPPDIDVDFEHERREEVIQHIYTRYGRERAGIAATVIRYRPKSAIRDVGKALGLTEDVTARLASSQWGSWGSEIGDRHVEQAGLDPANPMIRHAVAMASRLLGFPRHLSQHVGGFVLTQDRLDELVPIGNAAMADRTFIEWDKDDIDELRLMKVDVLALGMLTCIRKAFDLIRAHQGRDWALHTIPADDPGVYDMLCKGDSIGVFQVESRAQINMLPRLKPRRLYDLVIQVAIVRPGPIQGDMVHPYLRRRNKLEEPDYSKPGPQYPQAELKQVLEKTLGVPLFQEQAMKVAMVAAEFSDREANGLRKAMGTFRGDGTLHTYEDRMVGRMIERGYDPTFARRCFDQIKGFGSYGFPESHAASFAQLVYVSSWIKHHYPAAFACALLNSQPMGFYAPAQIVRDARDHDVEVRPVDVSHSSWDNSLEGSDRAPALRIGLRQIDGFREDWAETLVAARAFNPPDIETLPRRAALPSAAMRKLADADAFRSMGLDRRQALWSVRRLPDDAPLPLFAAADARELGAEPDARLPIMPLGEHVAADYQTLRLSLKAHPMAILRPIFDAERILTCAETEAKRNAALVRVAGVVLVRQRPGKGNAIFVTLEDETGITNVVLWVRMFEQFRREVMAARLMEVEGVVEKSPEGVVHLVARKVIDRSSELARLSQDHDTTVQLARADVVANPQPPRHAPHRHPRDVRILPGSRDFH